MPLSEPPADLSGFPRWTLRRRRALARIHRADEDARFFSSSTEGRFDLAAPGGTLYTADTAVGSFVEVFRAVPLVAQAEVDARRLAVLRAPSARRLANCLDPLARSFGVTAAILSTPDYALCQRWAAAFANAGFDGVRYLASHDPSSREIALAIFGTDGADASLDVVEDEPIAQDVIDEARTRFGILVLSTPG